MGKESSVIALRVIISRAGEYFLLEIKSREEVVIIIFNIDF